MNKSLLSSYCLSLVCCTAFLSAAPDDSKKTTSKTPQDCGDMPSSMRITARHIENKGIGYKTGYSTLEAFLGAPPETWAVMPFLDLRGHIFDDGKWAANGGLGLRSIIGDRVYGVYSYYDFRNANRKNYNQISFGVETTGTFWDARLNGYVVVGGKRAAGYHPKFYEFSENSLFLTRKHEYALSGANGEIGFHALKMKNVDLYVARAPYYFKGTS